ncbi:indole-3-glycerol phosphate synthase-domain-containing protein [Haematococcus lacustris]
MQHTMLPGHSRPRVTGPAVHQRGSMNARCLARAEQVVDSEVSIRRRPPMGTDSQPCGTTSFRVHGLSEENKPRNILEEIVWYKAKEIEAMRSKLSLAALAGLVKAAPPPRDFKAAIQQKAAETGKPGLIAEVKKASPSKGIIQPDFDAVRIAKAYEAGGAACLSVLTDEKFFQGSFDNLRLIRAAGVSCPLLCKEFIVEAYQVFKARASGADAILLIASVLPNQDLAYFMKAASNLGMQCLIEVHTEAELARVLRLEGVEAHLLGINNRDLGTFKVDLGLTRDLMASAAGQEVTRRGILMTGESGIFTSDDVAFVQKAGVGALLVGESLVKQGDPAQGIRQLLSLA